MRRKFLLAICLAAGLTFVSACSGEAPPPVPPTSEVATQGPTTESEAPPTTPPTTETPDPTTATESPPPQCPEVQKWNTLPDVTDHHNMAPIEIEVESVDGDEKLTNRCQPLRFHLSGATDVGFSVRYVDVVYTEGKGDRLPLVGNADLEVVIYARAETLGDSGKYFYVSGDFPVASPVTEIRFGGSFEGQSTYAVGVKEKKPFAARLSKDKRTLEVDIAR